MMMPRRRKTASSRVSGLLRTQRRCRRAFSLSPARIWARRTAQTRCSGIFLENPAVFCYFWNATAGAETAGLSPAAAPGPVGRRSEHAFTSWVCPQTVKNAQTAAFCRSNSVFWGHISGTFGGARTRPRGCVLAAWVLPAVKPSFTLATGAVPPVVAPRVAPQERSLRSRNPPCRAWAAKPPRCMQSHADPRIRSGWPASVG